MLSLILAHCLFSADSVIIYMEQGFESRWTLVLNKDTVPHSTQLLLSCLTGHKMKVWCVELGWHWLQDLHHNKYKYIQQL